MKSAWKMVVLLSILAVGIFTFLGLERHRSTQDLNLDSFKSIKFREKYLTKQQLSHFKSLARKQWSSSKLIYSKPDYIFFEESPSGHHTKFVSIWLKGGFLYKGYFLDAWTERMKGKKSKVYLLSQNMKRFLLSLK
jgi:hypothetical protein